jgi:ligand-binding SRPBCC domain-containing protein
MAHRYRFTDDQWLPVAPEELFPFFMQPTNLSRIMGDAMQVTVLHTTHDPLEAGAVIRYRFRQNGLPLSWTSRIVECVPPLYFVDEQVEGPFRYWRHTHRLVAEKGGTRVVDDLELEVPLGWLGRLAWPLVVRPNLRRTFNQRKRAMEALFPAASNFSQMDLAGLAPTL